MSKKHEFIKGFSKLSRKEKLLYLKQTTDEIELLNAFRINNVQYQHIIEDFSENVLTSFHLPLSVAPNFLINNHLYHVPMVTEESSVVAAASSASKFWYSRGGFHFKVLNTVKKGQVHFLWGSNYDILEKTFVKIKNELLSDLKQETENMEKRGGGITALKLVNKTKQVHGYYQLDVSFETVDAMGANFINSCLEKLSQSFSDRICGLTGIKPEIIMSILSNYTPDCMVECYVECDVKEFDVMDNSLSVSEFVDRFKLALEIAEMDVNRATTHNKGIFNGIDAVLIATGNDFRAVEASGHAFASSEGPYKSLTSLDINENLFRYTLKVPIALGTVGGVTSLHPQVKWTMNLLNTPDANLLMGIAASVGLANNFSAIKSLITKGIQKGHMQMHLKNILNRMNVSDEIRAKAQEHFKNKKVSYREVEKFVSKKW